MKATKCLKVSKTSKRKIKILQCNLQDVPTFLCYLLSDPLLLVPQVVDVLVLLQLLLPGALLQVLGYNICVGLGELLGSLLLLVLLGEEVVDVGHDDGNSWCEAEEKQLELSCKAILQPPLLSICKTLRHYRRHRRHRRWK